MADPYIYDEQLNCFSALNIVVRLCILSEHQLANAATASPSFGFLS